MDLRFTLANEGETQKLGASIALACADGAIIFLNGELGAGKSTLVRGLIHGLGEQGPVKSPTYTLVEPYEINGHKVFHFDLYRLGDPEELEYVGIRDYLAEPQTIWLVEWPQRGRGILPKPDLVIDLDYQGKGRSAVLSAHSLRGEQMLSALGANCL